MGNGLDREYILSPEQCPHECLSDPAYGRVHPSGGSEFSKEIEGCIERSGEVAVYDGEVQPGRQALSGHQNPDQRGDWPCDLALARNPRGRLSRALGNALVSAELRAHYWRSHCCLACCSSRSRPVRGGSALLTVLGFLVVNGVIGNILEPKLMGRRLNLSALVVFLSLVFWGWILGPIGMILSVPMTSLVKIALESHEETRGLAIMLGSDTGD
jgi:hypothetical protein